MRRTVSYASAGLLLFEAGIYSPARAQGPDRPAHVLLVSQPASGVTKDQFVDLAPHLQPALQETGKYSVTVFKNTLPAVQDAVRAGKLKAVEIEPPISREAARNIAKALGAGGVLHLSGHTSKDGIGMAAELEVVIGQNTWNQVYLDQVTPTKPGGKRPSLLESIHAIVDRIVQKMTSTAIQTVGANASRPQDVPKPIDNNTKPPMGDPSPPKPGGVNANPASAQPPAQGAVVIPPKSSSISTYTLVIDRARRKGDLASLIVALRKAITESPKDVRLRRDLAAAYQERGWPELAKEEALRAAALAPEDGSVRRILGDVLLESGDRPGALREYQDAARLSPQDSACRMALGDALMADGQAEQALKEFQAAAAADQRSPLPHMRIARLNVSRGSYSDAISALTAAKAAVGEGDASYLVADGSALLSVVESTLTEALPKMQQTRVAFTNGTKTREEAHQIVTGLRKKLDEISGFLEAMPDVGLGQPQALYGQAASMAVQAADKLLEHLEPQSTSAAEESNLLRIEANKQIGEASKKLKATTDAKTQR